MTAQRGTVFGVLVGALKHAGAYNKNDQVPPVAILWTDKERLWEPLIARLRAELPVLTLGAYRPDERSGPAYWVRCMIARALPADLLPVDQLPVIYLPGVSRQELRAVEDCPKALQPLAELQYRGVLWTQVNGRDWTMGAFLGSKNGGLGIDITADGATRDAMRRALLKLVDEPVATLLKEAPLRAPFFDALLNPDESRNLLLWLNDPPGFQKQRTPEEWGAFCQIAETKFNFHPEKDGPIKAALLLGQRDRSWDTVWRRFAEAPASYSAVPESLRHARPAKSSPLLEAGSWPQDNEAQETALRQDLGSLTNALPEDARTRVLALEKEHAERREWPWAAIGHSPLAHAVESLAALAQLTDRPLAGGTSTAMAEDYSRDGWKTDAALLEALRAVDHVHDLGAVTGVGLALYRPWLEANALRFQQLVAGAGSDGTASTYPDAPLPAPAVGTCLLFTDGLRMDLGHALAEVLRRRELACEVGWQLAALPPVTATAKPALAPVAEWLAGGDELDPAVKSSGTRLNVQGLRRLLTEAGHQVLLNDALGDPTGTAWTELGDIDSFGHNNGAKMVRQVDAELALVAQRSAALLDHGWQRVQVVTDHGWLLLPGGLPKADLPQHLTVVRKGRCARLKSGAQTDQQTVPWHWDASVRIAVAPGIMCYEAGTEYEHGGLSVQECVVPVLTVSKPGAVAQLSVQSVAWSRLRCHVTLANSPSGARVDLRTKGGDATTSLTSGPKAPNPDGAVSVLVLNEDREGEAALVVVLAVDGAVLAQQPTTIGA